jgi:transposase
MPGADPIDVGVDVSADTLDVAFWPSAEHQRIANTDAAITTLATRLKRRKVTLVVYEPTGPYHTRLAKALTAANVPFAPVNPYRARHFAEGLGKHAKTDTQDALLLAEFAQHHTAKPLPDAETAALAVLVGDRRHWVKLRAREKTRRHQATGFRGHLIDQTIALYDKHITAGEREIHRFLERHPAFRARAKLLQTMQGVGPVVAVTVLAALPAVATATAKQLAALVGVAPFDRQSGKRRGKATCWGGRGPLRATRYEGTLAAVRSNPAIQPFYRRLLAAGKEKPVALVACLRKFLPILAALVQRKTPFRAPVQQAA